MPDSSIGEGMDISIQGANGHVKHNNDTASLRSHDSVAQPQPRSNLDLLAPPDPDDKFTYSDMSIGLGMDISIRGEGDLNETKESYDENGWRVGGEGGPGHYQLHKLTRFVKKRSSFFPIKIMFFLPPFKI